jgi:hypothetical protein
VQEQLRLIEAELKGSGPAPIGPLTRNGDN